MPKELEVTEEYTVRRCSRKAGRWVGLIVLELIVLALSLVAIHRETKPLFWFGVICNPLLMLVYTLTYLKEHTFGEPWFQPLMRFQLGSQILGHLVSYLGVLLFALDQLSTLTAAHMIFWSAGLGFLVSLLGLTGLLIYLFYRLLHEALYPACQLKRYQLRDPTPRLETDPDVCILTGKSQASCPEEEMIRIPRFHAYHTAVPQPGWVMFPSALQQHLDQNYGHLWSPNQVTQIQLTSEISVPSDIFTVTRRLSYYRLFRSGGKMALWVAQAISMAFVHKKHVGGLLLALIWSFCNGAIATAHDATTSRPPTYGLFNSPTSRWTYGIQNQEKNLYGNQKILYLPLCPGRISSWIWVQVIYHAIPNLTQLASTVLCVMARRYPELIPNYLFYSWIWFGAWALILIWMFLAHLYLPLGALYRGAIWSFNQLFPRETRQRTIPVAISTPTSITSEAPSSTSSTVSPDPIGVPMPVQPDPGSDQV